MRVLPVQVDQALAERSELSERGRAPVDVRTTSPLRIEHAPQQQRTVVSEIVFLQPLVNY